ncbi:unnamed protein product [Fusarium graminearum]|uniref:Chromosome 2, complete genome n=1 Tax=Gibberella zeae (strain ATCC MYA-4620 / CBS 123657 / FGSC 9075 / NRRL 31084 / PH-1) TaxID=229533 RepID=A0A0E0S1R2_GIBZE|nr:hypothetical protein FG05_35230 [Fusarium graminearum]CEF77437.1 unnamed protein product [Fusarium graminearum]
MVRVTIGHPDPPSAPSKLRLRRENSILVGQCLSLHLRMSQLSVTPDFNATDTTLKQGARGQTTNWT